MKIKTDTIIQGAIAATALFVGWRLIRSVTAGAKVMNEEVADTIESYISDARTVQTDHNKEMLDAIVGQIMAEFNQSVVSAKDIANLLTGLTRVDLEYVYKKFGIQERRPFGVFRQQLDLFGFFDATLWNKRPLKEIFIYEPYIYR